LSCEDVLSEVGSIAEGNAVEAEAEWVWDDKELQGAIPISSGLGSAKLP